MKRLKTDTCIVAIDVEPEMACELENRAASLQIQVETFVNLVLLQLIECGGRGELTEVVVPDNEPGI